MWLYAFWFYLQLHPSSLSTLKFFSNRSAGGLLKAPSCLLSLLFSLWLTQLLYHSLRPEGAQLAFCLLATMYQKWPFWCLSFPLYISKELYLACIDSVLGGRFCSVVPPPAPSSFSWTSCSAVLTLSLFLRDITCVLSLNMLFLFS